MDFETFIKILAVLAAVALILSIPIIVGLAFW